MSEIGLKIRCQRCGAQMELRDPVSADAWRPDQFWVCPSCGRHFWTTYPPPAREKPAAAAPPAAAAATPAAPAPPAAQTTGTAANAPTTTTGNVSPNPVPTANPPTQS